MGAVTSYPLNEVIGWFEQDKGRKQSNEVRHFAREFGPLVWSMIPHKPHSALSSEWTRKLTFSKSLSDLSHYPLWWIFMILWIEMNRILSCLHPTAVSDSRKALSWLLLFLKMERTQFSLNKYEYQEPLAIISTSSPCLICEWESNGSSLKVVTELLVLLLYYMHFWHWHMELSSCQP